MVLPDSNQANGEAGCGVNCRTAAVANPERRHWRWADADHGSTLIGIGDSASSGATSRRR